MEKISIQNQVLSNLKIGITSFETVRDINGKIVGFRNIYANQAAKQLLGILSDLNGETFESILSNYICLNYRQIMDVVDFEEDFEIFHRIDDPCWEGLLLKFQKSDDGLTVTIEKNKKKANEHLCKALQDHADELEFMVNSVPHIVWRANVNGEVEFYNRRWYEYTGIDPLEGAKGKWKGVPHPDDLQVTLDAWKNSIKTGDEYKIEHRILGKNGKYRWMRSHAVPLRDRDNKIKMWFGTATDIDDEMNLRSAVEKQAKEFSIITEVVPQLIWTSEPDGSVTFFNHQWLEYTGISYEKLKRKGWKEALHPEDRRKAVVDWGKALRSGKMFKGQHRLRSKNGDYCWFLVRAYPLKNEKDEVLRWFGTYTNIHDQKTLEISKGEFLNIASHELRTPLTALSAYLQLIESKSGTLENFLPQLTKSVERLKKLVYMLLDISRIDLGKDLLLNFHEFNIDDLVKEVVDENNLLYNNRIKIIDTSSQMINADNIRIQQVLNNILSNAIKFSPENEQVTVSIKKINLGVEIAVEDKGRGVSKEIKERMFDRFYTSGNMFSGLGLGLFISKKIVEFHKGKIIVDENKNGKGITMKVILPIN